jgi:hypothetical protein
MSPPILTMKDGSGPPVPTMDGTSSSPSPTFPTTSPSTTKITLSFGGVDFTLHPDTTSTVPCSTGLTDDGINEVSYRTTSDNTNIILSLRSFTGKLVVSKTPSFNGDQQQQQQQQLTLQPLLMGKVSTLENDVVPVSGSIATSSNPGTVVVAGSCTKVEMEPDSPEATTVKKGRGVHRVSPGQKDSSSSSSSIRSSKENDRRKRPANVQKGPGIEFNATPKSKNRRGGSKKMCRREDTTTIEGSSISTGEEAVFSTLLCHQMTQATQDDDNLVLLQQQQQPFDLSQTVGSSSSSTSSINTHTETALASENRKRNLSSGPSSNHRVTFFDEVFVGNPAKDKTNSNTNTKKTFSCVQDILDNFYSSNDSVTTNRDDDDDNGNEDATVTMDDGDIAHESSKDKHNTVIGTSTNTHDQTNKGTVASSIDVGSHNDKNETASSVRPNVEAVVPDDDDMLPGTSYSSEGYPPPPARWGHSMTQVQDGRILVYGGQSFDTKGNPIILSDVHVYDVKTRSWHKPINCRGEARQWHTATYIPSRQQIIAFGGETIDVLSSNSSKSSKAGGQLLQKTVTSDTLRVLDTDIMLWYPPAASGDIPTGRSGHSATFFPETNELVLFGGVRGSKWLNTVSVLDVTRWIWTTPKVEGSPPKPRSYHTATAVGGNGIVVFGGNNMTSCFSSVHVLEMTGGGSSRASPAAVQDMAGPPYGWKWSHPTVTGKVPFPRTGHSATLLDDGKTICIYGGWDPNEEDEATGGENIFQGSYLLDTQNWTWLEGPKAQPGGSGSSHHHVEDCGPKRCGHTAALNSETGEVLVFGGRIPNEVLAGDVQVLVARQEKAVRLEG